MIEIWYKVRGYLAGSVALLACPCHLALTLPLLLTLTAGTALGAFLSRNSSLVIAASTVIFLGGLALAFRWLGADSAPSPACPSKPARLARSQAQIGEQEL